MSQIVRSWKVGVAVIAAGGLMLAAVAPGIAQSGNKYPKGTDVRDCGQDNTITFEGAKTLWPPNHKYQSFTITAEAGNPMDMVSLSTTVSHDQEGLNGSGPPTSMRPDAVPPAAMDSGQGSASVSHSIRSSRSGRDMDGRTYTIEATATFNGNECTETFEVHVPHDMRNRGGGPWGSLSG